MDSDLKPSLVMESSKDNYQVLFVCERRMESANDDKEDEAAKQVLNALKKRYGADQNVGLTQPFRMAGFNNKKQGRNNFIVKLHYWSEQMSEKIRETIDKVKKAIVVDKQEKTVNVSRAHKPSDRTQPSKAAYEDFKKLWRRHRDFAYTKVKVASGRSWICRLLISVLRRTCSERAMMPKKLFCAFTTLPNWTNGMPT